MLINGMFIDMRPSSLRDTSIAVPFKTHNNGQRSQFKHLFHDSNFMLRFYLQKHVWLFCKQLVVKFLYNANAETLRLVKQVK